MLNVMRDNLRHLKWVLWLVAISMTLYLGYNFEACQGGGPSGVDATWAALVEGRPIPREEFRRTVQNMDRNYRQVFGQQYEQLRPQLRLGTAAVEQLINRQIILLEAEKLGIQASAVEVDRAILDNPNFQDAQGRFIGAERVAGMLSRTIGVEAYRRQLASDITIQKWLDLVVSPVSVTEQELLERYRDEQNRTAVDYVVVATADQDIDTQLGDEDLRRWYDAHQDDFRRAEGRTIRYVVLKRADRLDAITITDEDVADYYAERQAEFTRPEQRSARHILLKIAPEAYAAERNRVRGEAERLLARLKDGSADFESLAREHSEDPGSAARGGDLGFFGRGQMVPPFEQAAFDTPVGALAPLTETDYGYHIIEVTGARPGGVAPLDEVRDAIRQQLRQRGAEEAVEREAQRLRSEVSSAEALAAIAAREGLDLQEQTLRPGDRLPELGVRPGFVEEILALEPGAVAEVQPVREGRALLVVTGIAAADVAPLAEVRGEVRAAMLNDRARTAAREAARQALSLHGSVARAAEALDLEIRQSGQLPRGQPLPGAGGSSPELTAALFGENATVGSTGVSPVPGGAVIYEITERQGVDDSAFSSARPELEQQVVDERRDQLLGEVLARLRDRYEVRVNDELVTGFNI